MSYEARRCGCTYIVCAILDFDDMEAICGHLRAGVFGEGHVDAPVNRGLREKSTREEYVNQGTYMVIVVDDNEVVQLEVASH